MEIRRLSIRDASEFRQLRLRALREHPQAFTSSADEDERQPISATEQRLQSDGTRFWGAFDGTVLRGIVGLEREHRAKNRHKGTLVGMYVAPEASGRGIGAALIDRVLYDARASGLELLVLTVTDDNGVAVRLYERAGFRSFGIEPDAIRVDGRSFGKKHMYLGLAPS
jgi:ribosomal protein S18 acetylase RimI-like enzyme